MLFHLTLCVAALLVLVGGAELIVRGGTPLAGRLGLSPFAIGLTVVAIGTSSPELAVGIESAMRGNGDLAVGNIAGTNIVNILLILGLSALMQPLALGRTTLRQDLPMIVAASFMLLVMAWNGTLTRIDGSILLAASFGYTVIAIRAARRETAETPPSDEDAASPGKGRGAVYLETAALIVGIAVIVAAAEILVQNASELARAWGVPEGFIGLTIVAIGTSSPELATTIVSTIRGNRDIAVGNLLGSSVYNILFILGVTCLFADGGIQVDPEIAAIDIPLMAGVALLCIPIFYSGRTITRWEGGSFVVSYLVYLTYLVVLRA